MREGWMKEKLHIKKIRIVGYLGGELAQSRLARNCEGGLRCMPAPKRKINIVFVS